MTTPRLESPLDQDLHRSAHNLRALVIAKGLANVVALIATAVMAHAITPEDRGIVALAVFYVTFGVQVFDIGVDPALQRLGSDRHWVSAHLFVRLITAVMLTLLGIGFYLFSNTSEPVKTATLFLAVAEGLRLIYTTPRTIMELQLRLPVLAFIEFGAVCLGALLGIALAWLGFGWKALLIQIAVVSFGPLPIALFLSRSNLSLELSIPAIRQLIVKFGVPGWLGSSFQWLLTLDVFLVSRFAGTEQTGHYALAMSSVMIFGPMIAGAIARTLVPIYARHRDDREAVGRIYHASIHVKIGLALPLYVAAAISAPLWFASLYGSQWAAAELPFQLLVLFMWMRLVADDQSVIITVVDGQPKTFAWFQAGYALCFLPIGVFFTYHWGPAGAAAALLVATAAFAIALTIRNVRSLNVNLKRLPYQMATVLVATIFVLAIQYTFPASLFLRIAEIASIVGAALLGIWSIRSSGWSYRQAARLLFGSTRGGRVAAKFGQASPS